MPSVVTGPFIDSHMACSSLGHILGICSPTRSLHLELCNHSQHLFELLRRHQELMT